MDRMITIFFKVFVYPWYRRRYRLTNGFRFNGYFIRIAGNGKIVCGENCYLSYFSYVDLANGGELVLGDNVSIGHNVKIYTNGFNTKDFIVRGVEKHFVKSVTIGNQVLIGSNVYICPGVKIGNNVVVGANSVVTSDLMSDCVYAGSPAIIVKDYRNV